MQIHKKMNQIEKLWKEIQEMPFPSNMQSKDIDGINPYEIASLATDCISSYFDSDQELERDKKEKLKECMEDLRSLNPKLRGDAQVYFGKLYRLCDLVYKP